MHRIRFVTLNALLCKDLGIIPTLEFLCSQYSFNTVECLYEIEVKGSTRWVGCKQGLKQRSRGSFRGPQRPNYASSRVDVELLQKIAVLRLENWPQGSDKEDVRHWAAGEGEKNGKIKVLTQRCHYFHFYFLMTLQEGGEKKQNFLELTVTASVDNSQTDIPSQSVECVDAVTFLALFYWTCKSLRACLKEWWRCWSFRVVDVLVDGKCSRIYGTVVTDWAGYSDR